MRIGGLAWYIAGFVSCLIVMNDGIAPVLHFVVAVLSGAVAFLGAVGTLGLVVITAFAFWWITRTWTENARAKFDMDRTRRQRRNYRLPPSQRAG